MAARSGDEGAVELSVVGPEDWRQWRELRRAALAEAPAAFGSTLAEWSGAGDTEDRWRDRLSGVPLNLVARFDGRSVGMVSATPVAEREVGLISMWVAPEARGRGVGDALVEAVTRWAADEGAEVVALSVRVHNDHAVALYRRCGFADDGPSPSDPSEERRMVRPTTPSAPGAVR
jgi:ribosomal protein S18 acetylase RimI-like enzyme